MKSYFTLIFIMILFIGVTGCSDKQAAVDLPDNGIHAYPIKPVKRSAPEKDILPPQTLLTLCKKNCNQRLLGESRQMEMYEKFKKLFYAPWGADYKILPKKEALWGNAYAKSRTGYGQNLLPYRACEIEKFVDNTNPSAYPGFIADGIVVHDTNFRVLPTDAPFFYKPMNPGQGYPFDYFQNSKVYFNTPIKITHISKDRGWVYAQSYFVSGWLNVRDIALVDETFKKQFTQNELATPNIDNLLLQSTFLIEDVRIGTVFPASEEDGRLYYATKSGKWAILQTTKFTDNFSKMPLVATEDNIAQIAEEMIGSKYGWGSFPDGRDCSMMVRDIYVPFGIYLPRNSRAQVFYGNGEYVDLSEMTPEQKEQYITRHGVPFLSLIYMKGHIMLYVGSKDDKALAFHDIWGIRTEGGGRYLLGGAVLSTLDVGKGLSNYDEKRSLLQRITGLKVIK